MNPVLRPACLSDMFANEKQRKVYDSDQAYWENTIALEDLYDAEWRKRGFQRSP